MKTLSERDIPKWKKVIHALANKLIMCINNKWTGNNQDFVVQFACMDMDSYINIHRDHDVSSQISVSFG